MSMTFYHPLRRPDSIRLLKLENGSEGDPISCSLLHIEMLAQAPPYECISYVWSDPAVVEDIQCCAESASHSPSIGKSSLLPFPVTISLASVLRHLRLSDKSRILWADAICINQNDVRERGHQVGIMGKIYAGATLVYVWLGHSDGDTQPAIELIKTISQRCSQFTHPQGIEDAKWEAKLVASDHFLDYLPERDDRAASTIHDPRSASLDRYFGRSWFKRTWVIQEVAKCKTIIVYCGKYSLPWNLVALAASWCLWGPESYNLQDRFKNVNGVMNAHFMRDKVWHTADTVNFLTLLGQSKDFDATDSRDKVYAMLSYPTDRLPGGKDATFHLRIEPDYTKSVLQIYNLVAVRSMQYRRDLEVLSYVDHGPALNDDFPSWIPRWDHPCTAGMVDQLGRLFDAGLAVSQVPGSGPPTVGIPVHSDEQSLTLSGVQCGIIRYVTDMMDLLDVALTPAASLRNPLFGFFRQSNERVFASIDNDTRYLSTEESIFTAYARTLSLGRTLDSQTRHPSRSQLKMHTADFAAYILAISDHLKASHHAAHVKLKISTLSTMTLQKLTSLASLETLSIDAGIEHAGDINEVYDKADAMRFNYALGYACHKRKFFKTSEGHIGFGPAALTENDILCIFRGGRMVYALREYGKVWKFIGECYVHGLMQGEAIKRYSEVTLETEAEVAVSAGGSPGGNKNGINYSETWAGEKTFELR